MVAPCTDVEGTVDGSVFEEVYWGLDVDFASRCVRGGLSGFGLARPEAPSLADKVYCSLSH